MSSEEKLQFTLNQNTSGWYVCRAENGIGDGIEKKIKLQINGQYCDYKVVNLSGKMNVALSIEKSKL